MMNSLKVCVTPCRWTRGICLVGSESKAFAPWVTIWDGERSFFLYAYTLYITYDASDMGTTFEWPTFQLFAETDVLQNAKFHFLKLAQILLGKEGKIISFLVSECYFFFATTQMTAHTYSRWTEVIRGM